MKYHGTPYKLILGIILIAGAFFVYLNPTKTQSLPASATPKPVSETDSPQIVSTKPDPLNNAIVPATENIEITFNRPLQNIGEFKVRIEPKIDYKVELSGDRKTAKIIFQKPLELGLSYTLYIGPDTKFDGTGDWGQNKDFHFRTIPYKGV